MKQKLWPMLLISAAISLSACVTSGDTEENIVEADVIVYGGTSAAVSSAVQLVRLGKSVIMVSPDLHLGGLTAGGLGWTDTGNKEVIGGLSREFYHRIFLEYQKPETWVWQGKSGYGNQGQGTPAIDGDKKTMWIFEPHVAEKVFEDLVSEHSIEVYRDEWLDREKGVIVKDGAVQSIKTLSGKEYKASIFIDASYEGDLMAAAGISYHIGREASNVYDEEWNGVQTEVFHHGHQFNMDVDPYLIPGDPSSSLLPKISGEDPGEKYEGDQRIQAYCFRTCMTTHPENRIPFTKPEGYDPAQYELLVRIFDAGWREVFHKFDPIPNLKTDVNNHGPFSFDNIGMSYDYPEAEYEKRQEIILEHKNYQLGLLYFIANDPRVPSEIQSEMQRWGLSMDEFTDNGNWPHQIYVREARRMIGEYIMNENDVQGKRKVPHPVGIGSYTMDSHNVQRYVKPDGFVQNEGDIGVHPPEPYQIDMGSLMPKRDECRNLLVPVCVSSSHIAFGSIRMEPVFIILGQSAAVMAAMAIDNKIDVQDIEYSELQKILEKEGQVLSLEN